MFIRKRHTCIDKATGAELRSCFLGCAFEGELRKGGIGCVVAQTGVVEIDRGFLDRSYDEVADRGDILIC
jgi:hypothetical protein